MSHKLVVLNTEASRIAEVDVNLLNGAEWVSAAKATAGQWLQNAGKKCDSWHVANGDLFIWVS